MTRRGEARRPTIWRDKEKEKEEAGAASNGLQKLRKDANQVQVDDDVDNTKYGKHNNKTPEGAGAREVGFFSFFLSSRLLSFALLEIFFDFYLFPLLNPIVLMIIIPGAASRSQRGGTEKRGLAVLNQVPGRHNHMPPRPAGTWGLRYLEPNLGNQ